MTSKRFWFPIVAASLATGAPAADLYPWRNHENPFGFLFGNEIDGHQQTRPAQDGSLRGFLYVRFTGLTTKDRYPVATHVDCAVHAGCTVGWTILGRPADAALLYRPAHDHPVFLVQRTDIPQPGAHAHFHWLGATPPEPLQTVSGYLLQLIAADRFCFVHHGAENAVSDATCRANGGVAVDPGIDIATHLNIVTSAP
jgi:hypothetical protein